MSDENDLQNPIPEENSSPASPQEPTEQAAENTAHSEPSETTQEPQEAPGNDFKPKVIKEHIEENQEIQQNKAQNDQTPQTEENSNPEPSTAQTLVNEPLENKSKSSLARQLLISARNAIQFRKRKKLDRVMSLFLQKSKITNDEVEKFLHVSDATATRYLSILEKEGKIKQSGKTGKGVSYSRI